MGGDGIGAGIDRGNTLAEFFPEAGSAHGEEHFIGEVLGVACLKVEAVDAVVDLLRHAADVAGEHGTAVHEGLLDHKRGVFPPVGRDDGPVGVLHVAGEVAWLVRAAHGDVGTGGEEVADLLLEIRALAFEIRSVDAELDVAHLAALEDAHGLEEDQDPLVGVDLAEEGEMVAGGAWLEGPRRDGGTEMTAVLLIEDAVFGDAPLEVAAAEEVAGSEEAVNQVEMGFNEQLAHAEVRGGDIGEALVTAGGCGGRADGAVMDSDHLAVEKAHRDVLVESVNDGRSGEQVADEAEDFDADEDGVMEVDNVGLEFREEAGEVEVEDVEVILALEKRPEAGGGDQGLAGVVIDGGERGTGVGLFAVRGYGAEQEGGPGGAFAHARKKLICQDFGASFEDIGVAMRDVNDLGHALVSRCDFSIQDELMTRLRRRPG